MKNSLSIKNLYKNAGIYSIGNIGIRATSFLLIPIYLAFLSNTEYGMLAIYLVTIQLTTHFINLGMRDALVRFKDEFQKSGEIGLLIGSCLVVSLFISITLFPVFLIIITQLFQKFLDGFQTAYLIICYFISVFKVIQLNLLSVYRAFNNPTKFMIYGVCNSILIICCTLISLQFYHLGIFGILLSNIIAHFLVNSVLTYDIIKKEKLYARKDTIKRLINFGFPYFTSNLSWGLLEAAPLYFIGFLSDYSAVAIFSLAFKFSSIINIALNLPLELAFSPILYENLEDEEINERVNSVIYSQLSIGCIFAYFIILLSFIYFNKFTDESYLDTINYIFYLTPAIIIYGFRNIGQVIIFIDVKPINSSLFILVFVFTQIALMKFIINKYSLLGAVISCIITYVLSGIILLSIGYNKVNYKIKYINLVVAIMGIFIIFIGLSNAYSILDNIYFIAILIMLIITHIIYFTQYKLIKNKQ